MALDDIVFAEGDLKDFILEISLDTLHSPSDILDDARGLVLETAPVQVSFGAASS